MFAKRLAVIALMALTAGCATQDDSRIELPLVAGWYEGEKAYYLVTDTSDEQLAQMMRANYVPRLANALPDTPGPFPLATYDRVYKFVDGSQPSILPSIPIPLGAGNNDTAYSPLWHVYEVTWVGSPGLELRSANEVLLAQEQGRVRIRASGAIVNCPVVRVGDRYLQAL